MFFIRSGLAYPAGVDSGDCRYSDEMTSFQQRGNNGVSHLFILDLRPKHNPKVTVRKFPETFLWDYIDLTNWNNQ